MPDATFFSLVTNIGRARIATALSGATTVGMKHLAVGDGNGNAITPDVAMTGLVREVHRVELSTFEVDPNNPNFAIFEGVIPTDVGGWTVREVGIFDADGNLIAVGSFPETYKPIVSEGSGRDLVVRFIVKVEDGETAALELQIDPSIVLASRSWVQANFGLAVEASGGLTGEVLRKASNADGDTEWASPAEGLNVLADVVTETQSLSASQTVVNLATATTVGAAFYQDGIRLHPSDYTINSDTQLTLAAAASGGEELLIVQNDPANALDALQAVNNLSDVPNKPLARDNLGVDSTANILLAVLDLLYPVGETLITLRAGSPDTWDGAWAGFGTWERHAAGRVLVGHDPTDADFNTVGQQGGAKRHTLTAAEMAHFHGVGEFTASGNNDARLNLRNWSGSRSQRHLPGEGTTTSTSSGDGQPYGIGTTNPLNDAEAQTAAHNKLQPYTTVFIWKRTA